MALPVQLSHDKVRRFQNSWRAVWPAEERSGLTIKFPENREFNREFSRIRGQFGALGVNSRSHFNVLSANSLLSRKQRILEQFQCVAGEFPEMAGTGNFSRQQGISFP
jgi:hypothetical protein